MRDVEHGGTSRYLQRGQGASKVRGVKRVAVAVDLASAALAGLSACGQSRADERQEVIEQCRQWAIEGQSPTENGCTHELRRLAP